MAATRPLNNAALAPLMPALSPATNKPGILVRTRDGSSTSTAQPPSATSWMSIGAGELGQLHVRDEAVADAEQIDRPCFRGTRHRASAAIQSRHVNRLEVTVCRRPGPDDRTAEEVRDAILAQGRQVVPGLISPLPQRRRPGTRCFPVRQPCAAMRHPAGRSRALRSRVPRVPPAAPRPEAGAVRIRPTRHAAARVRTLSGWKRNHAMAFRQQLSSTNGHHPRQGPAGKRRNRLSGAGSQDNGAGLHPLGPGSYRPQRAWKTIAVRSASRLQTVAPHQTSTRPARHNSASEQSAGRRPVRPSSETRDPSSRSQPGIARPARRLRRPGAPRRPGSAARDCCSETGRAGANDQDTGFRMTHLEMRFHLHSRRSGCHARPLIGQAIDRYHTVIAHTHATEDTARRAAGGAVPRKPARSEEHGCDRLPGFRRQSFAIHLNGEVLWLQSVAAGSVTISSWLGTRKTI